MGRLHLSRIVAASLIVAVCGSPSVATAAPSDASETTEEPVADVTEAEAPAEDGSVEEAPAEEVPSEAEDVEAPEPEPIDAEPEVVEEPAVEADMPELSPTAPDPVSNAAPSDASETLVSDSKTSSRSSGEHLRPRNHSELLGEHEVDLDKARYKPGTGLTFTSKNERFELATRLRAQFRYTLQNDNESGETTHGLTIRRARLQFKGHVFNKNNKFKTELALSPRDMGFDGTVTHRTPILDWYFDFTYFRDFTLRIGQYKVPYSRQRVVSSGDLQLVDRSIANGEFNLDRDIGFDVRSKDFLGLDKLRYYAGMYFGEGRDQYRPTNFDMFYLARVEVLPFGIFKDYKEADFERSLRPRLSLGAAYAFVDGAVGNRGILGSTPSDGGTTDYHNVTADLMFKIGGFSAFGDVFYRQGRRDFGDAVVVDDAGVESPAPREMPRDGIGWSGTAGYMIPRVPFELAARYAQVVGVGNATSLTRRDEVGGGLSYYFAGHPLKLQADYFAQFADGYVDQSNHVMRVQLQAAF